jgi:hypothetical protein
MTKTHEDPTLAPLRRLLQEEGFETDDAGDGYEAIEGLAGR